MTASGQQISYRQLQDEVTAFAARLGQNPGPIALLCDGSYHQYVAYLAALNAGCPVLLMGADQTPASCGLTLRFAYDAKTDVLDTISDAPLQWHPDLAVLLSTSGSTGAAKWVRLSYANLGANAGSIASYLTLTEQDRAPMALPFQYSYGMSVLNSHLAVGASVVLTDGSVVDQAFWQTFEATQCTSFAGVPHSFELMEQAQVPTGHLAALRYMTQAGGRLGEARVKAWVNRGQQEGWDFFVMYGQTEAAPRISYLPPDMAAQTPSAIGIPIPGGDIWVQDAAGNILPDGETGELCYRGANTMMGYATGDDDLVEPQGDDVLNTGDVARRLPNGAFEIVGRLSRFVKLFGLRISLDEVEKHLTAKGIEAACVAQDDRMFVVIADPSAPVPQTIAANLAQWLDIPATSFEVIQTDTIPRQPSGKIDLRAVGTLVTALAQQEKADTKNSTDSGRGPFGALLPRRNKTVASIFEAHFHGDQLTPEASFTSLGGDSLSYVAVSLDLENVLGRLPPRWERMTIAQLQATAGSSDRFTQIDAPTLIRALSIMLIVAGHFGAFSYGGGGAKTLFVIAGISLAAFTLPQVAKSGGVRPIATLGLRIALLTFAYTALNFAVTGYGAWPAFVFVGNWVSPTSEGSAWFIEVYLQVLLLAALALAIPPLRQAFGRAPFKAAAVATSVLIAVAAASDALVDTNHLFRRLPHIYGWIMCLGVVIGTAHNTSDRLIATVLFALGYWQFSDFTITTMTVFSYFPIAVLVLIWCNAVTIPRLLSGPIRAVAGASLLIYLSHFQFAEVSQRLFGDIPAVSWLIAILGGVMAWRIYERAEISIRKRLHRQRSPGRLSQ